MVLDFFKEFVRNPVSTGAIAPSSDELAELITDKAELKDKKLIVELGSGTGIFTEKIMRKKDKNSDFIVFEINPKFVKETKKRVPDVKIYNDSAVNIKKYINKKADCIISELPWAGFSEKLQNKLLNSVLNSLKPNGVFLTFAYIHGVILPTGRRFKQKLNSKFKGVKTTRIVWKNMPPAFAYVARK